MQVCIILKLKNNSFFSPLKLIQQIFPCIARVSDWYAIKPKPLNFY